MVESRGMSTRRSEAFLSLPPPTPKEAVVRGKELIGRVYDSLRAIQREPVDPEDLVYFLSNTGGELPYCVVATNRDGTLTLMSIEDSRKVVYRVKQEQVCRVEDFNRELERQLTGRKWQ